MYLTTVKRVLRNSFDLNYLRKMCGTWVQAARLPLEPGEAEKLAAFLFRSPLPVSFPLGATRRQLNFFGRASVPCFCSYPLQAQHLWQSWQLRVLSRPRQNDRGRFSSTCRSMLRSM